MRRPSRAKAARCAGDSSNRRRASQTGSTAPGGTSSPFVPSIDGLSFHPDGTQLAVVSQTCDKAVLVLDVPSGAKRAAVPGTGCHAVGFSSKGGHLVIAANNDIFAWDLEQDRASFELRAHASTVNNIAFASDGSQLVSVSNDRNKILWIFRTKVRPERWRVEMTAKCFVQRLPPMDARLAREWCL